MSHQNIHPYVEVRKVVRVIDMAEKALDTCIFLIAADWMAKFFCTTREEDKEREASDKDLTITESKALVTSGSIGSGILVQACMILSLAPRKKSKGVRQAEVVEKGHQVSEFLP